MSLLSIIKSWFEPKLERYGEDLTRIRLPSISVSYGDWRWGGASIEVPQYRYFCKCGTQLTEGPRGGAACSAVCEKCKINYGCVDFFEFE